jgi:predicted outer membrane lipoprotein
MEKITMKKPIPLWLIGLVVWVVAFGIVSALWIDLSIRQKLPGPISWPSLVLIAVGPAGLVVMIVQRIRSEPTPEQRAAFWALLVAEPGTIGAVVVKRKGKAEVIATVRSVEEYWMLAAHGKLPHEHTLVMAAPEEEPKPKP